MEDLANALLQGRRAISQVLNSDEMPIAEFVAMSAIEKNDESSEENIYADDLRASLFISKPAVSQMMKSLESRGFINRTINPKNRRKLTVTLTQAGREALFKTQAHYKGVLSDIIAAFGEEKSRKMVQLFIEFSHVTEKLYHNRE